MTSTVSCSVRLSPALLPIRRFIPARRSILAVALGALFLPSAASAQSLLDALRRLESSSQSARIEGLNNLLATASKDLPQNARLSQRAAAVAALAHQNDRISVVLIHALVQMDERAKRPMDEAVSDYWGDLIGTVAALHDPRAILALVGAVETGGLATSGLVALGDAAVQPLAEVPDSASVYQRAGVTRTLGRIAMQPAIHKRDAIKDALKAKLTDPEWMVRSNAIEALATFSDTDLRPIMWQISKHDRYRGFAAKPYPIRAAATAWLKLHPQH